MHDLVVERVRRVLHAEHRARLRNGAGSVDGPTQARCLVSLRRLVERAEDDIREQLQGGPPVGRA